MNEFEVRRRGNGKGRNLEKVMNETRRERVKQRWSLIAGVSPLSLAPAADLY